MIGEKIKMEKVIWQLVFEFLKNPLFLSVIIIGILCGIFYKKIIGKLGEISVSHELNKLPNNQYLTMNNVPFDKMIVGAEDKGLQCVSEGIDVFIDDNIGNCRAVRDKGIKTIRFDSGFKERDNSLINVRSWNEVYELLFGE